jgi:hypothetical protein
MSEKSLNGEIRRLEKMICSNIPNREGLAQLITVLDMVTQILREREEKIKYLENKIQELLPDLN